MELVVVEEQLNLTVEEQLRYKLSELTKKEEKVFNDLQRVWYSKGALFKETQEELGLNQKEVAKFFGLKVASVERYLRVHKTLSKPETLPEEGFKLLSNETTLKGFCKAAVKLEKDQKRKELGVPEPTPKPQKEEVTDVEAEETVKVLKVLSNGQLLKLALNCGVELDVEVEFSEELREALESLKHLQTRIRLAEGRCRRAEEKLEELKRL